MSVKFTLEMDGVRSVITATIPRDHVKDMILREIEARFNGKVHTMGEDRMRFLDGCYIKGRYFIR